LLYTPKDICIIPYLCPMTISSDKVKYTQFCQDNQSDLPLFYTPAWLDAVCGKKNWGVNHIEENGKIIAVLPYYCTKKMGLGLLTAPPFTPYLGAWSVDNLNHKTDEIAKLLIDNLPKHIYHSMMLPQNIDFDIYRNLNYTLVPRVTHIIEYGARVDTGDKFNAKLRSDIRYAQQELMVMEIDDVDLLLNMMQQSFDRQKVIIPAYEYHVRNIYGSSEIHSRITIVCDVNKNVHGAMMTVEDGRWVYNICSGRNTNARRGAIGQLLDESIKYAFSHGKSFDFEGSSLPGVAAFYKTFGASESNFMHAKKSIHSSLDIAIDIYKKIYQKLLTKRIKSSTKEETK
jgi:hypothetical protein